LLQPLVHMGEEHFPAMEAIRESVRKRLRLIFTTRLTAVLDSFPRMQFCDNYPPNSAKILLEPNR